MRSSRRLRRFVDVRAGRLARRLVFVAVLASAPCARAFESTVDAPCKENPALVGPCFEVHGRVSAGCGTPGIRLWPVGTRRMLGVSDEGENLPQCVSDHLTSYTVVFGDFLVCPLSPDRPGVMRAACIESASNVVVQQHGVRGHELPPVIPKVRSCRLGKAAPARAVDR